MEIDVLKFDKNNDPRRETLLGMVQVLMGKKMFVWMSVLMSKKGHVFCKFPAFKQGNDWIPYLGWIEDTAKEKLISDEVSKILKEKYLES